MPDQDFEQLAIDLARGRVGLETDSHWNLADEYVDRHGRTRAACGQLVDKRLISGTPTCQECKAFVDAYDALVI